MYVSLTDQLRMVENFFKQCIALRLKYDLIRIASFIPLYVHAFDEKKKYKPNMPIFFFVLTWRQMKCRKDGVRTSKEKKNKKTRHGYFHKGRNSKVSEWCVFFLPFNAWRLAFWQIVSPPESKAKHALMPNTRDS